MPRIVVLLFCVLACRSDSTVRCGAGTKLENGACVAIALPADAAIDALPATTIDAQLDAAGPPHTPKQWCGELKGSKSMLCTLDERQCRNLAVGCRTPPGGYCFANAQHMVCRPTEVDCISHREQLIKERGGTWPECAMYIFD
jgi:hypothetical protein